MQARQPRGNLDIGEEIQAMLAAQAAKEYNGHGLNTLPANDLVDQLIGKFHRLGLLWRQLFRLSPVNLRPLLGRQNCQKDPQSIILFALCSLEMFDFLKNEEFLQGFRQLTEWILEHRSGTAKNFAMTQQYRLFVQHYTATAQDLCPYSTAFAGILFLKAFQYLGDEKYLELAEAAGRYFSEELAKVESEKGLYFYYVPNHPGDLRLYNVSAIISAFMIKLGHVSKKPFYAEYGQKGLEYLINVQNPDGSWFYSNSERGRYIDNFHTAFILLAFHKALKYFHDKKLKSSFDLGLAYYKQHLFHEVSPGLTRPVHFDPRFWPHNSNLIQKVDLRDAALAICLFSLIPGEENATLAREVLAWTMSHMKGPEGYYCELTWFWANKIAYIDFEVWMALALVQFLKHVEPQE